MNPWQNYIRPKNLSEAMDAFADAPRPVLPIAGGTDLWLDFDQGRHSPIQSLIDVTSIAELNLLEQRGDELFIGGAIIGLAGPTYSLSVKAGWNGTISGLDGFGWIALSITIFGGWNPLRAAFFHARPPNPASLTSRRVGCAI